MSILKTETPTVVSDYRPVTLFSTEYKILVRPLANRPKPTLDVLLHQGQKSRTTMRNIMDATSGIHDVIALGEMRNSGICLVALNFASEFDKISHECLFRPLETQGYGDHIVRMISSLHTEAYWRVYTYINGWHRWPFGS
jgi:hypothetical protein